MLLADPAILEDPRIPEGVKDYFRDYAKERLVLGRRVLVISQRLHWNHEDHDHFHKKNQGIGPGHTIQHIGYDKKTPLREDTRKGVEKGTFYNIGIATWMREYEREGGVLISELHEVGERYDGAFDD